MDVIDNDFRVHLDDFTGPLDLLLHLVRTHEMEVRDLPLAQITAEYVEMLQFMKKIDLEPASEFLEIAAGPPAGRRASGARRRRSRSDPQPGDVPRSAG